jgi:hypothetical protein
MSEATDQTENDRPEQRGRASSRLLRLLKILQLVRRTSGRLLAAVVLLAFLFASIAILQHWFVHKQVHETTKQELGSWAEQVTREIGYKDKWDLNGYRQASITAPSWYVLTKDGLIIDIEGFIPGLFGRAEPMDESIYAAPKTVITPIGEMIHVFGKKVAGGCVIVCIRSPENTTNADAKHLANASKFGSTIEEATSIGSREIDFDVDYAVVGSNGELKLDWGEVPLKTDPRALPLPSDHVAPLISSGKPYLLYFQPILDRVGQQVGTVIVPKDMSLEQQALKVQDRFNFCVVAIAFTIAFAIIFWLMVRELLSQAKKVTLEEALKVGESRTIEFKSTFQWDVKQKKIDPELRLAILKSIAGFLNAKGGTLFIGITEDEGPPSVRGLVEDLEEMGGNRDKLQLTLRNLITDRIGSAYSHLLADSLEESGGKSYWVVVVEESPEPAFVRWKPRGQPKEQKIFYIREGPKTSDLDNESTWHYIKNKWG